MKADEFRAFFVQFVLVLIICIAVLSCGESESGGGDNPPPVDCGSFDYDCDGTFDDCDDSIDLTDADCDTIIDGCDDDVDLTDADCDLVIDGCDNDVDLTDADCDTIIDACDDDVDSTDADCDLIFDACDDDIDSTDSDCDGIVDGCDDYNDPTGCNDSDGDGIADGIDNCPDDANSNQADSDCDGTGDVCDDDIDTTDADCDGTYDGCAVPDLTDADCDGNVDGCVEPDLTDTDMDGIADGCDNCPTVPNGGQANSDSDGDGDACDCDSDDGVCTAEAYCDTEGTPDGDCVETVPTILAALVVEGTYVGPHPLIGNSMAGMAGVVEGDTQTMIFEAGGGFTKIWKVPALMLQTCPGSWSYIGTALTLEYVCGTAPMDLTTIETYDYALTYDDGNKLSVFTGIQDVQDVNTFEGSYTITSEVNTIMPGMSMDMLIVSEEITTIASDGTFASSGQAVYTGDIMATPPDYTVDVTGDSTWDDPEDYFLLDYSGTYYSILSKSQHLTLEKQ